MIALSSVTQTMEALSFGPKMSCVVKSLGSSSLSQLLVNRRIVGSFRVTQSIKQGCPLAPLLFAVCSHPLALALEKDVAKEDIKGLTVQDDQLLLKMFANNSMPFLKVEDKVIRNALTFIQIFAIALGSQCNIDKSRLISLIEGHSFGPSCWNGKIVHKGVILKHLGTPLGVDIFIKQ